MELFDAIKRRHRYRGPFLKQAVPETLLEKIVQAGLLAPSGCNAQTTSFVVVTEPGRISELASLLDKPTVPEHGKTSCQSHQNRYTPSRMKTQILILIGSLALLFGTYMPAAEVAPAADPPLTLSERLDLAHTLLQQADLARDSGQSTKARHMYQEAIRHYTFIQTRHASMEPEIINFRLAYCQSQVEQLTPSGTEITPSGTPRKIEPGYPAAASQPAVQESPAPPSVTWREAHQLLMQGRVEAAMPILMRELQQQEVPPAARTLIAVAQCMAGRFDDAERMLTEIMPDFPESATLWTLFGAALAGNGKPKDAIAALKQALTLNDNMPEAHFNLAQMFLFTPPMDAQNARKHYQRALELGMPPDPELAFLLK